MMHFRRLFQIPPLFPKSFTVRGKFSQISPFFHTFLYISEKVIFPYFYNFPVFSVDVLVFPYFTCFFLPPSLTMMHLCIKQCTYWTPLMAAVIPQHRPAHALIK